MRRDRQYGYTLPEFTSAFCILVVLLFTLINLTSVATGAVTGYLVSVQTASAASQQRTLYESLLAMTNTARSLRQSGLGQFAKLRPVGGLQNEGVDAYIDITNYQSNSTSEVGPNSPLPPPIDTANNIYQIRTKALYDIGPFLNLSSLPFVRDVPLVGKPVRMNFTASRTLEDPRGFLGPAVLGASGGGSGSGGSGGGGGPTLPNAPQDLSALLAGWNYPGCILYVAIISDQQTGQSWAVSMYTQPGMTGYVYGSLVPVVYSGTNITDLSAQYGLNGNQTIVQLGSTPTPETSFNNIGLGYNAGMNPSQLSSNFLQAMASGVGGGLTGSPNAINAMQTAWTGFQSFAASKGF